MLATNRLPRFVDRTDGVWRRLIVFIDESGLSERPTRVRTWAPKGCTPVIQFHFNWKHVSVIAGLTRTNFVFRLHDGAIKSAQIVEFLKALRAQLKIARDFIAPMVSMLQALAAGVRNALPIQSRFRVLPTIIDTPQNRADMPAADPAKWVAPEALADVVLFLASGAARAVHGALVPVTGLS